MSGTKLNSQLSELFYEHLLAFINPQNFFTLIEA